MRVFAVMLFLVLTAAPFFGAGIILHDGTIIQGKIVSTNKTELTLESQIGVITIVSNPQYNLLLNSLMAFPLVLLLAHLSYTAIERPFLTLRRRYVF